MSPASPPSAGGARRSTNGRRVVYCLVPPSLASKLHELLREHFREDPSLEVIIERREAERRSDTERRVSADTPPGRRERRRIRSAAGRRVGERRAAVESLADPPSLPRRARRHSDALVFLERIEPAGLDTEDLDTARLVNRFQSGDQDVFADLYRRYFDRVYGYLLVALENREEAEDATQQVFLSVIESLARYERRAQPFRAWLFTIARNRAVDVMRRSGRIESSDPQDIDRHLERNVEPEESALPILNLVSDRDLVRFVERLPLAQRQVLMLSFSADLSDREIGSVLDRSPESVRMMRSRALAYLRSRLTAVGRGATTRRRARVRARIREAPILRSRRWALHP